MPTFDHFVLLPRCLTLEEEEEAAGEEERKVDDDGAAAGALALALALFVWERVLVAGGIETVALALEVEEDETRDAEAVEVRGWSGAATEEAEAGDEEERERFDEGTLAWRCEAEDAGAASAAGATCEGTVAADERAAQRVRHDCTMTWRAAMASVICCI